MFVRIAMIISRNSLRNLRMIAEEKFMSNKKMTITVEIDEDWTRKKTDEYKGFFEGYIGTISGLTVSNIVIEDISEESISKSKKS
jgi:hypothetical protein